MKTITCFITTMSSGGAEHQLAVLAAMLVEKGYNVSIVTFADTKDHYVIDKRIKRIKLGYGKSNIIKFLAIFYFFLTVKTDCIISFGQRENMFMLLPMLFRPKIKVIAGERNFTTGKSNRVERILFNFLYRRATFIVPNSHSQKMHIISKAPQHASKVVAITNYTDLQFYAPIAHQHNDVIQIAIFCRYSPQKNYERFAKAIQITKKHASVPFVVNWYGNKTVKDKSINPHYQQFKKELKELNVEDNCILHDHTSDVFGIMSKSDVFCLPSLYEGFSNSLSEAICCRMPVLASDVSDNSVMTHHGINGFLFDPYDEKSIADAILHFLSLSTKERDKMSAESRKIAVSLFDKETFIGKYISLIEQHL